MFHVKKVQKYDVIIHGKKTAVLINYEYIMSDIIKLKEEKEMKRKALSMVLTAAMVASMTTGMAVSVSAEENTDFAGEELSILVSAGWMDNRYDATICRR